MSQFEDNLTHPTHTWKVIRTGGFDQVEIRDADDIANLDQLDQKLWVALACPVKGLELDEASLTLIDEDGDNRIRVPEIVATGKWVTTLLKNGGVLFKASDALKLSDLSGTDEAKAIAASAQNILDGLGDEGGSVTLAQVNDTAAVFAAQAFNGDGVIDAKAAENDEQTALIAHIIETTGGAAQVTGEPGVDTDKLDAFFADADAYLTWWGTADGNEEVLPLGDATKAAADALIAVEAKIDDWFTRCALVAFDPRAGSAMNRADSEWGEIALEDLTNSHERIAAFPIAHVVDGAVLPLTTGLNPAWAGLVHALRDAAVKPLLGDIDELTSENWGAIKARLAPFRSWDTTKAGANVEPVGLDTLRAYVAGTQKDEIAALIAKDLELKPEADGIGAVEKLIRVQRDFVPLLENFINFKRFYSPTEDAAFQTGTLFMDKRSCDLVVRVDDAGKHAKLAGLSYCYLTYLTCTRKGTTATRQIAAAFTNGDVDFLMVGRNGVFYDRDGNDWDATITKVVANPISIRQAFWAPYKRVAKMVEEQIEKFAASKDADSKKSMDGAKAGATDGAAPAAFDIAKFAGIFAAAGLAVGAIASGIALLATGFFGLTWWQMPLAVIAILLIISGPSMLLAALKLSQRSLGPVLEANGWAINSRARINIPFGESLTNLAVIPDGTERDLKDPYAEKKPMWTKVLMLLAVLGGAAYVGYLNGWLEPYVAAPVADVVEAPVEAAPAE
ncbi:MAG: hypothetical protein GY884_35655 [Proteobacteria bacterium]|nr:hypothetical protein [Pseudomonadota bacterium]